MSTNPERAPKDRSLDRHDPAKKARIIRPAPPDLWERLGALVGERRRNEVISDLIARFLDGRPMRPRPRKATPPHDPSP